MAVAITSVIIIGVGSRTRNGMSSRIHNLGRGYEIGVSNTRMTNIRTGRRCIDMTSWIREFHGGTMLMLNMLTETNFTLGRGTPCVGRTVKTSMEAAELSIASIGIMLGATIILSIGRLASLHSRGSIRNSVSSRSSTTRYSKLF